MERASELDGALRGRAELGAERCGVLAAASEHKDLDVAVVGVDPGRGDRDGGVLGDHEERA
jgi:hypothetical protein